MSSLYLEEERLRASFIKAVENIALLERSARALIKVHRMKVDRLKEVQAANKSLGE